ncbi:MAG: tRNA (adenosine(37)-N6)-threonylcarbamoyltransferase complex ATPase subunit type 1 TsaE [Candidatus Doudnabacteria bacterium]|nr:tRNA (adenosine(37)-N6)-threonylcarbamoyltransferase complex ATPase subunit type 1 TsaE [Candidatus Doudnabacteria bacterium]
MEIYRKLNLAGFRKLAYGLAAKNKQRDLVIGLSGVLGSGKTAFIKAFAKKLGLRHIKSPSFIIMAAHKLPHNRRFYHLDLYRIKHIKELSGVGLEEIIKSRNRIVMIEWIDKFPKLKKQCKLLIQIEITNVNERSVKIKKL